MFYWTHSCGGGVFERLAAVSADRVPIKRFHLFSEGSTAHLSQLGHDRDCGKDVLQKSQGSAHTSEPPNAHFCLLTALGLIKGRVAKISGEYLTKTYWGGKKTPKKLITPTVVLFIDQNSFLSPGSTLDILRIVHVLCKVSHFQ